MRPRAYPPCSYHQDKTPKMLQVLPGRLRTAWRDFHSPFSHGTRAWERGRGPRRYPTGPQQGRSSRGLRGPLSPGLPVRQERENRACPGKSPQPPLRVSLVTWNGVWQGRYNGRLSDQRRKRPGRLGRTKRRSGLLQHHAMVGFGAGEILRAIHARKKLDLVQAASEEEAAQPSQPGMVAAKVIPQRLPDG